MNLTTLSAAGLKGQAFTHQLGAVNLICGQPFTGKTTRLHAARLLLMGYVPELGKSNQATMALASGPALQVGGSLDGQPISRQWTRTGKGISAEQSGDCPEIPPVLMDPSTYFGLGAKDQIRYVFGLSNVEAEFNVDSILADLKNLSFDPNTEATQAALTAVCGYVDESDRDRNDAGGSIQDWVDAILVKYFGESKLTKAAIKEKANLITGMAKLRTNDATGGRDQEAEIARLQAEHTRLSVEAERLKGELEASQKAKADRADIQASIYGLEAIGPMVDREEEIAALQEQITKMSEDRARITAELNQLTENEDQRKRIGTKLAGITILAPAKLDMLAKEVAGYQSKTIGLEQRWGDACLANSTAVAKRAAATGERARLENEMTRLESAPCCPTCGATGDTLRELVTAKYEELIRTARQDEDTALLNAIEAEQALEKATKALEASRELDDSNKRNQETIAHWTPINQAAADLQARLLELPQAPADDIAKLTRQLVTLCTNIANAQAKITELQASQRAFQAVQTARAKLSGIPEVTDEQLTRLAALQQANEAAIVRLQLSLSNAQTAQKAFLAARQDKRRMAEAELAKKAQEESLMVLEAVVKYFESLKVRMVATAFGGLLEKANQVASGILKSPLVYQDGQLGRMEGPKFIGHETFSGTEKAVTYAGLSVALAWDSPIRIVLMDELGNIGPAKLVELLEIMKDLTAKGFVHQFIGVSIVPPAEQIDGVKVIELSPATL